MPSIKRRGKSSGVSSPSATSASQRLSQASLQKAFFSMLACVSVFYFLLIFFFFFQRHDLRVYRDRGDFNHSIRSHTAEAWKHHLEKLSREQDERQQRLREQTVPVQSHHTDHKDLEEPDIEEMIRPEEIRGRKDGVSKNTSDKKSEHALTVFASSNLDSLLDAGSLKEMNFPTVSSCSSLYESLETQSLDDPFLPKLHRVVPSSDASYIYIAAQHSIPCGNETDSTIIKKMHLQAALFQPISVKRIERDGETKYQVISDKNDTSDAVQTRFLCRFEPSGDETLSNFSQQDDTKETSASDANLFFHCPVPSDLIQNIKQQMEDHSEQLDITLTLVPFRTPPSAQSPEDAMPPCYLKPENMSSHLRRQSKGEAEYLPKIANAARWENIPICLSSAAKPS
ncbi:unnamed protein product [Cylindrotheca closterium]|uniref:Uncharacterized protein n=1 Tax=Cylindrotheca closterium TaxID=2856 RepID=A0AAD2JNI5_9STRA|nr:unnamed protein product [Cylindrotheca closterium]